jgi:hypothetical protein
MPVCNCCSFQYETVNENGECRRCAPKHTPTFREIWGRDEDTPDAPVDPNCMTKLIQAEWTPQVEWSRMMYKASDEYRVPLCTSATDMPFDETICVCDDSE